MKDTGQEQHYTTSELARMFDACPTPLLANADLQKRWQCSRSTVDRIRKVHGLRSDGPEGGHPLFDLLPILELEGMPDPLRTWVLGTDEDRQVLAADLLSIEDLKVLDRTVGGQHAETFRRRARNGKRPGFRLGKRWLFRPTIEDLARLNALRKTSRGAK